jgi:hypothetical protein
MARIVGCGSRRRGKFFSVKSCYTILQNLGLVVGGLTREEAGVFHDMWKSKAPSKVLAFPWTMILERIPTKVNLDERRLLAIDDSLRCVFCGMENETIVHLFLHCHVTSQVRRGGDKLDSI